MKQGKNFARKVQITKKLQNNVWSFRKEEENKSNHIQVTSIEYIFPAGTYMGCCSHDRRTTLVLKQETGGTTLPQNPSSLSISSTNLPSILRPFGTMILSLLCAICRKINVAIMQANAHDVLLSFALLRFQRNAINDSEKSSLRCYFVVGNGNGRINNHHLSESLAVGKQNGSKLEPLNLL